MNTRRLTAELTVPNIILLAQARIADLRNWTKHVVARGPTDDIHCDANNPLASCWCLDGALQWATGSLGMPFSREYYQECSIMDDLIRQMPIPAADRICFNDLLGTNHKAVIDLMDEAYEVAVKKEGE